MPQVVASDTQRRYFAEAVKKLEDLKKQDKLPQYFDKDEIIHVQ